MKCVLSLMLLVTGFGFSLPSSFADDLSRREEKRVLRAIDQVCGDTWCEGDYNFRFKKLVCNFTLGICTLEYEAGVWPAEGEKIKFSIKKTCSVTGVSSISSLIEGASQWDELQDAVYEQINLCISHQLSLNL